MVSVDADPKPPRIPPLSVLAPRRDDEQVGAELVDLVAAPRPRAPCPRPTVRMTAVMPMRMPSIVSAERRRCGPDRVVRGAEGVAPGHRADPAPGGGRAPRRRASSPSRIWMMRSARAATSCSCVISTIVRPGCAARRTGRARRRGRCRVEVPGRLVGEDQRRLGDERAGDRDPLLLAAGELAGPVLGAIGEADAVERAPAPASRRSPRSTPGVHERELDVAPRRQVRRAG